MLREHGFLFECLRCRRIILVLAGAPALWFKHVDDVLPAHEVDETAVQRGAEFALFMFNVQRDNVFTSLTAVYHQQLHKIGLALTGIAEDEDICGCLVLVALVEVREDVAAVSVLADVEAVRVGFTGIIIYV